MLHEFMQHIGKTMQRNKRNQKPYRRKKTLISALSFAFLLLIIGSPYAVSASVGSTACAADFADPITAQTDMCAFDFDQHKLALGGIPFGVKLSLSGVVVVETSQMNTASGPQCPAQKAGIRAGDIITKINGEPVLGADHITGIIESSQGKSLNLTFVREGREYNAALSPQKDPSDGKYKVGFWIRDNAAGIGTVTFIDTQTGVIAGLGHGICDAKTGMLLPFNKGEIMSVTINGVQKGQSGDPGELKGVFKSKMDGALLSNNNCGVFGKISSTACAYGLPELYAARKSEVKEGKAELYCTTDQGEPHKYEIEISKINNTSGDTKNFVVKIADPALIEKTGGIVQGMSGSPIVQNGKLVGAVTHVLINDPTKGYGIFIENMISHIPSTKKEAA